MAILHPSEWPPMSQARRAADEFREADHPRDQDGKFGAGGSGGGEKKGPAVEKANRIEPDRQVRAGYIEPVNEVTDQEKFDALVKDFEANGWHGRPVVAYGDPDGPQAITGSHRIHAAREAGIDVPVVMISPEAEAFEDEDGNTIGDLWGRGDDDKVAAFLRAAGDDRAADLIDAELESDNDAFERQLAKERHARDALAFDRATVRSFDQDGRLHVAVSNISKANICGYRGSEIPDSERLGLDQERIYQLLRDPQELAKAAPTFNNIPILSQHVPVSVDDHRPELIVGSTGTDGTFVAPYLRNSLVVWSREAIDGIESGGHRELSCAYRYDADMTPGTFEGVRYDGVMRNIRGNHVALVPEGRAGADVVVGDAALPQNPEENPVMPKTTKAALLPRRALVATTMLSMAIKPKLAQDAKVNLAPVKALLVGGLKDAKAWRDVRPKVVTALDAATKGKLAQDASLDGVIDLIDKLDTAMPEIDAGELDDAAAAAAMNPEPVKPQTAQDTDLLAKLREFLAGKIGDEDMAAIEAMCAPQASDEEKDDEGKKNDKDDGEKKPPFAKDKDMVDKKAMDAAVKAGAKLAEDAAIERMQACRKAEIEVEPFIGKLPNPPTTAAAIYKLALDHKRVDLDGVPESAYGAMVRMLPRPSDDKKDPAPLAMDASAASAFDSMFEHAGRIKAA